MNRNIAIKYCPLSWGFIADADARPSNSHATFYSSLFGKSELNVSKRKQVFIVPALEFSPKVSNLEDQESFQTPSTKKEALALVHDKILQPMHINSFPKAYSPTNYIRWYSTSEMYEVPYSLFFEPYFIAKIDELSFPFYDERFVNFGINKGIKKGVHLAFLSSRISAQHTFEMRGFRPKNSTL